MTQQLPKIGSVDRETAYVDGSQLLFTRTTAPQRWFISSRISNAAKRCQKCWRIDRQNENSLEKSPRNFERRELSLESSLRKIEHRELSRELSRGMRQWVSRNFGDLSPQFRGERNFVEKPGKARKFVEIDLHYFCTIL